MLATRAVCPHAVVVRAHEFAPHECDERALALLVAHGVDVAAWARRRAAWEAEVVAVFGPAYEKGFGAFMFSWDVLMASRKQAWKSDGGGGCRRVCSCYGEERVLNICSGR